MSTLDSLVGKFHAHFTVDGTQDAVLAKVRGTGMKATIISLYNDRRSQIDPMLTKYYVISKPNLAGLISAARTDAGTIESLGLPVRRIKLEYEGDYTGKLTCMNYFEAHIKLALSLPYYAQEFAELHKLAELYGFVLSRNPLEVLENSVLQFANIRVKSGTYKHALDELANVHNVLTSLGGIKVVGIKKEINIYDSNQPHDSWWA